MNRLEPEDIAKIRSHVRKLTGAVEAFDRRGFRLLQWPSLVTGRKPIELSLEHEVRLKPPGTAQLHSLLTRLTLSAGQAASRLLLPGSSGQSELIVMPVLRRAGPQSLDVYFDFPEGGFASAGYTFRHRLLGRRFMTWDGGDDGLSPLNLELPAVDLKLNALTARLEFNWLDNPATALLENFSEPTDMGLSPVRLTAGFTDFDMRRLVRTFENTTVRQKFLFQVRTDPVFALNIDLIRTRHLQTNSEGRFVDVDLSPMHPVDDAGIEALSSFSEALTSEYGLEFNFETKASRARRVIGAP
jgi:hypothetical protein